MSEIIDLTRPFDDSVPGFDWEVARDLKKNGWNARNLKIYSHAGTHMDAPFHFGVSEKTIDEISLNECICAAWVVYCENIGSRGIINIDHLGKIKEDFAEGEGLVFKTNWSRHFGKSKFRNELPRIGEKLAYWCVEHHVKMIGVEPPSVADVNNRDEVTNIHRILLGGNIIIVEGLVNLELINEPKILFAAIPLKIVGGDGAPCRAMAIRSIS
jgi:kynurenine formamidase